MDLELVQLEDLLVLQDYLLEFHVGRSSLEACLRGGRNIHVLQGGIGEARLSGSTRSEAKAFSETTIHMSKGPRRLRAGREEGTPSTLYPRPFEVYFVLHAAKLHRQRTQLGFHLLERFESLLAGCDTQVGFDERAGLALLALILSLLVFSLCGWLVGYAVRPFV